jgi:peptidoglycan/xylan/chitin deacetylase (PgdA/CDA1 family)
MKRFIKFIISIIFLTFIKPFQYIVRFFRKEKPPFCIILFYHSVLDSEVRRYRKQLNLLSFFTEPVSIENIDTLAGGKRYSVMTFDDAYQNVIKNAAPELIKRKIPFTIFIPAGQMGEKPGWLANTGRKNENEKIATLEELLSLPADLVTLGSHTVNHPQLSRLSEEQAYHEISLSRHILESLLKRRIRFIAIPNGEHEQNILDLCKLAGYEQVFTIKLESPFIVAHQYGRGRNWAAPSDWDIEFILKILGAYDWLRAYSFIKSKIISILPRSLSAKWGA